QPRRRRPPRWVARRCAADRLQPLRRLPDRRLRTLMGSEGLHEPASSLSPETIDHHRAIRSLMEELEAIDWYDQRVNATDDDSLRAILAHNRDEEKEHAAMALEWLRRRDEVLDRFLR